ncbi:MAG TPA: hypothetical protein VF282_06440 [Bacillota bacterium]
MHYFLALMAGLAVGLATRNRWTGPRAERILGGLIGLALVAVLGGMAARLGADGVVRAQGALIGTQAAVLAAAALAGSVGLVALCRRWLP